MSPCLFTSLTHRPQNGGKSTQNVYDPTSGRYVRFPFFSGSHGWQWARERSLNDSSVWTYDLGENRWRNRSTEGGLPTPRLAPDRSDGHAQGVS